MGDFWGHPVQLELMILPTQDILDAFLKDGFTWLEEVKFFCFKQEEFLLTAVLTNFTPVRIKEKWKKS